MIHLPKTSWTTLDGAQVGSLALGGYYFDLKQWTGDQRAELLATMDQALDAGVNHFDTASDYGGGESERLLGTFLNAEPSRRSRVFLATKASIDDMDAGQMAAQVEKSCQRLRVDTIDLFYIHWPRQGKDPRPLMEGLMRAKRAGRLRHIGVSNFSVEQMRQVREVGPLDAHQLGYNLFWRKPEQDVIPFCQEHGINAIAYSAIAQGIMTGKFEKILNLPSHDGRSKIVFFKEDIWPSVYQAVEELRSVADTSGRPLVHLAILWVLTRPGIKSVVVGARNTEQLRINLSALQGEMEEEVLKRAGEIGAEIMSRLPDLPNMYNYRP